VKPLKGIEEHSGATAGQQVGHGADCRGCSRGVSMLQVAAIMRGPQSSGSMDSSTAEEEVVQPSPSNRGTRKGPLASGHRLCMALLLRQVATFRSSSSSMYEAFVQHNTTEGIVFGLIGILLMSCLAWLAWVYFHPNYLDENGGSRPAESLLSAFSHMPPNILADRKGRTASQGSQSFTERDKALPSVIGASALRGRETERGISKVPAIYPKLVLPHAHTRLAIPVEPLKAHEWDIDVLGLSGTPLLCAALKAKEGVPTISITLHNVCTLLAVVNSALEVFSNDGSKFGILSKDGSGRFLFNDLAGQAEIVMVDISGDTTDFQLYSLPAAGQQLLGMAQWRPAGTLPAEHYEVTAKPGVDSVLILACVLAVLTFCRERGSPTRESSGIRSQSSSQPSRRN